jgi:enoyl-CoA hydratase/carnithine racemase
MLNSIVAYARAAAQANARAFVLRGEGKVFSAGADLTQAAEGLAVDPIWENVSGAIAALPCLTIAALNGTLAGGAMGMALACDLRISVANANFFYPVMKLGFLPQPSDPARMVRLIGPARTKMILMAGAKITAQEALNWGLIDRIVDICTFDAEIDALTRDVCGASADHVTAIKAMI